jgi:hypothetical protein
MGRGRLTFKGEKCPPTKKSKISKIKQHHPHNEIGSTVSSTDANDNDEQQHRAADDTATSTTIVHNATSAAATTTPANQQIPIRKGKGQITVSGTVITGYNTKFLTEINAGDAIMVHNPQGREEMRVVTMRLSDTSCAISSSFPSSYKTCTDYFYIPRPRNTAEVEKEKKRLEEQSMKQKKEEELSSFGTYSRSDKLVYHEKSSTGTSYIIRTENLGREVTRGELLNMRSKKKSDKYCN